MLTMSRSFWRAQPGRESCPALLCRHPECGDSSRLRGLPKSRAILELYLAASRSCSETPGCYLCLGQDPCVGGCVTQALGERMDPGRARSPLGMTVSDLRSGTYPSAACGPVCPEQPY